MSMRILLAAAIVLMAAAGCTKSEEAKPAVAPKAATEAPKAETAKPAEPAVKPPAEATPPAGEPAQPAKPGEGKEKHGKEHKPGQPKPSPDNEKT